MSRIIVFDLLGNPIGEIDALSTRSWVLNSEGEARFDLSLQDENCREDLLRFGNLIAILHESLPDWYGVIDTDRQWGNGTVSIMCYTLERLLRWCPTSASKVSDTAGGLFERIIAFYNETARMTIPIRIGEIYRGGAVLEESFGNDALTHAARIAERSGNYFRIRGQIDNGKLGIYADLYRDDNRDVGLVLKEGINTELQRNPLTEIGPIWNWVIAYGDTTSDGKRVTVSVVDEESIARFGKRGLSMVFSGMNQPSALEQAAREYLLKCSRPRLRIPCSVVLQHDYEPDQLSVGRWVRIEIYSAGFWGESFGAAARARILAARHADSTGKIELEVEVSRDIV